MIYNRETDVTYGLTIEGGVRRLKQLPDGDIIALIEHSDIRKSIGQIIKISK